MAYISAQDTNHIRVALKAEFPEFKFSVRTHHNSSVQITIVAGPVDFGPEVYTHGAGYCQVNSYHTERFYGKHAKFLDRIDEIAKTAPGKAGGKVYFNETDAQIDYFHVAYYVNIHIGAWDKPYQVVAAKAKKPAKAKRATTRAKKSTTVTVKAGRTVKTSGAKFATVNEVAGYNPRDNVAPDESFTYYPTLEQLKRGITQ